MTKLKIIFLLTICISFCLLSSCRRVEKKQSQTKETIRVGVFDKNGDSPWCITDALEALHIDPNIKAEVIRASQIMSGELDGFDAIVFPGGSGRGETQSMGELGMEKLVKMVKEQGKAVVGICAGAYIMTETPDYPSLALNGCEAIDIEHDHRGHGLSKFSLTKEGQEIFPELKDRKISFCQYYEGPVLVPAKSGAKFIELATMLSDVHTVEDSPAYMTNKRPFVVAAQVGIGRVASFVGHPECTPGMRWMLPRMVRWTCNKELISYPKNVVRPDFFKNEIIYTKEINDLQTKYQKQLSGTKAEKLEGIEKVIELACWSSKKWIPGLLRDKNAMVRVKASWALIQLERTDAIPDLEAAVMTENDKNIKIQLKKNLKALKAILGTNS
ncbi:biofilm PGA synthesis protein PgaB [Ancylomarina sp. 16SWW S1-10-2]|uniref:biofilm PGA synthesis protein PgaB n=1 Tax=Ancylomarina sp. 16SWW S1-10-2 TaxID=2499681 RepID=UPI0012AEB113|nr:biofilm PGA synthesis protein PgaB [Ancylomarina sp. 16SWW S1-10-2]MRT92737.1 biofilm PGA synthesis protein PgaB [Ancylomarina sp. 16SWW S1-10-2]